MSKRKSTIASVSTQQTSLPRQSPSTLDWNVPKAVRTPRSEYRFMRNYSLLWAQNSNGGSFGGFNGGGGAMKAPFNPFKTLKPRRPATPAFKPIRFNRRQVALMVRVADYFHPNLAQQVGEPEGAMDLYADLIIEGFPLTPALLKFFGLKRDGRSFLWNPR